MKKIGILGSTGSVGSQALDIINTYPNQFELIFITGHTNTDKLIKQINKYVPKFACLSDPSKYKDFKSQTISTNILSGEKGLEDLCSLDVDIVLNAISGYKGLSLSVALLKRGIDLALSNKESIVQAGSILNKLSIKNDAKIFPVDSEHSALWQCIIGEDSKNIRRLILTGSGGPFRNTKKELFNTITKEQALKHPNWAMGNKITIDSATMMNKGFEVIEAHWLFNIDYDNIDIVIHPESIIHSMVEFIDGSIKAQLSHPTMEIPIQFAFTYPNRLNNNITFDFTKQKKFTFEEVDYNKFRCIKLAYQAGRESGTYPAVLNVSNDIAVDMFLNDRINFNEIPIIVEESLNNHNSINSPDIDDIKDTILLTEEYIANLNLIKT